ncbi:MAG: antirestriction protein ArdA [Legionella sp.]|nr:antirestriction protein ArdA [Legionella sp.]
MDTPKIYVVCLASYNSGILYGHWLDVNQSLNMLFEQIDRMLAESPIEHAKEWAIHNYEGFGEIRLSEFEDLEIIIQYAKFIIKHKELGQALIAVYGIKEAQTMIKEQYYGSYDCKVDFAEFILEECYGNPIPDKWLCYFDYEAFARDLFIDSFCSVEVDGNVHVFSYH